MQEHNFDQILDFLCSGIMSKSERQSVRDELYDHLMCRYETNLAVGMDEEKAAESAINDLGDKTVIKHRLSQVHSYYPALSMKKAMNLLIVGYVLMTFQINFFTGMGEITKLIGNVIMLVGVYCISKANKRLKQTFYIDLAGFATAYLSVAIQPFVISDNLYVSTAFSLAGCVLNLLFWIFLAVGLNDLVKPYLSEYKKKIPLGFMGLCQFCVFGGIIILHLAAFSADKLLTDYPGEELLFAIPFIVISAVVTLFTLYRVSKCLWNSDHEYKIEDSSAKKWVAAILALAVAIIPLLSVDWFVATEKADTEVYSIDDSDIPQAEYERICSNLLSYGIPERLVYTLPESEIEKFKYSVPFEELINVVFPAEEKNFYSISHYFRDEIYLKVHSCAIGIIDEHECTMVRYMTWFEYYGDIKRNYSDYITMDYRTDSIPPNFDEPYNGDLFLILSEENGELLRNEPLEIYTDEDYLVDSICGVKYQAKDNLLMYYGTTTNTERDRMFNNLFLRLYHRVFPFTTMRNPPERGQNSNDIIGFDPFTVTTEYYIAFPGVHYITEEQE